MEEHKIMETNEIRDIEIGNYLQDNFMVPHVLIQKIL
jgi:hypothetical protein